jgi:hypothetical protein
MSRKDLIKQKTDALKEKQRKHDLEIYLTSIRDNLGIAVSLLERPLNATKYLSMAKYSEHPLDARDNSSISNDQLFLWLNSYLDKMVFQGDGLLFVGAKAQLLQKDWLKLHASDMAELIKYDIHKSDLNYTYELLITSIDSDSILGLFEDEYKYVINIFKSES